MLLLARVTLIDTNVALVTDAVAVPVLPSSDAVMTTGVVVTLRPETTPPVGAFCTETLVLSPEVQVASWVMFRVVLSV